MSPQPFKISIPDAALQELAKKLALARFPDELDEAEWSYGTPLADIKRLTAYWKDGFDWRAQEARINATLPQFTQDIPIDGFETLNIHFVHKKSELKEAIPLLFYHGWPGSFLEVTKILPLLTSTTPGQPSFHVVAPSLPNFGFSEGTKKQGFNSHQYAEVGHKLMLSLGYDEYVVQGGDWGSLISRRTVSKYGPKHAKAWHTNMPFGTRPTLNGNPLLWLQLMVRPLTPRDIAGLQHMNKFRKLGSGYQAIQSTKPQTIGYALADSPVGLLAWIYEKLVEWTDGYHWSDDEVLTWISVYWFSRAGPAASVRIYYEILGKDISPNVLNVPHGISRFPKELYYMLNTWIRTNMWLVFESAHDSGGHFAAHEKPNELVGDLRSMFGKTGPVFGVVPGQSGYVAGS